VQIGLKDLVNAAITSGVTPGEVVSLGARTATQTTRTTTQSSRSSQSQDMGRVEFFGGPPGGPGGP
jgi:hypothetical protein